LAPRGGIPQGPLAPGLDLVSPTSTRTVRPRLAPDTCLTIQQASCRPGDPNAKTPQTRGLPGFAATAWGGGPTGGWGNLFQEAEEGGG